MGLKALTAKYFVAKTLIMCHAPDIRSEQTARELGILAYLKKADLLKYLKYCICFNDESTEFLFKIDEVSDDQLREILAATTPHWLLQAEGKEKIEDCLTRIRRNKDYLNSDTYVSIDEDGVRERNAYEFQVVLTSGRSEIEPEALRDLSDE